MPEPCTIEVWAVKGKSQWRASTDVKLSKASNSRCQPVLLLGLRHSSAVSTTPLTVRRPWSYNHITSSPQPKSSSKTQLSVAAARNFDLLAASQHAVYHSLQNRIKHAKGHQTGHLQHVILHNFLQRSEYHSPFLTEPARPY